MSIALGKSVESGKVVELKSLDRFGNLMIVGPNGCGKTSKIIKPCIWQDLVDIKNKRLKYEELIKNIEYKTNIKIQKIKQGNMSHEKKLELVEVLLDKKQRELEKINPQEYVAGLTCIEPKGDLADDVVSMCQELELPYIYINPLDENTHKINIMQGDPDIVAESNRTVLRSLFGKQEAFFAQVQETTARNTMLLLKKIMDDKIDLVDVARALRSDTTLKTYVDKYEQMYGTDDLVEYYRSEVFGTLKDKFYQFALGLRSQLEDISNNKYLKRVLLGNSDIRLDEHLEKGTILIVNTAMGPLGKLGDTFGQFVIMHLQNAVFRRPGNEWNRAHHFLWIDEAPRYLNPDMERLLAIGRSYRCSVNIAIQSLEQLQLDAKREFAEIVITNCRNKVVFGGLSAMDAKQFEANFGAVEKNTQQYTYNYRKLSPLPSLLPKSYRTTKKFENRYNYTDIIELKSGQKQSEAIVRYYKDGAIQTPTKIITSIGDYKKPGILKKKENKLIKLDERFERHKNIGDKGAAENDINNKGISPSPLQFFKIPELKLPKKNSKLQEAETLEIVQVNVQQDSNIKADNIRDEKGELAYVFVPLTEKKSTVQSKNSYVPEQENIKEKGDDKRTESMSDDNVSLIGKAEKEEEKVPVTDEFWG